MSRKPLRLVIEIIVTILIVCAILVFSSRHYKAIKMIQIPLARQLGVFEKLKETAIHKSQNPESKLVVSKVWGGPNGEYMVICSSVKYGGLCLMNRPAYSAAAMCVLEGNVVVLYVPVFEPLGQKQTVDLTFAFFVSEGPDKLRKTDQDKLRKTDQLVISKDSIIPYTAKSYYGEVVKKNELEIVQDFPDSYEKVLCYLYSSRAFTYMVSMVDASSRFNTEYEELERRIDQWWNNKETRKDVQAAKYHLRKMHDLIGTIGAQSAHKARVEAILKKYM